MKYDFDIIYWAGPQNIVPDFLSRIHVLYSTGSSEKDDQDLLIVKKKKKSLSHSKIGQNLYLMPT